MYFHRIMRYIKELTAEQIEELTKGYKQGSTHSYRRRCQCILLSYQGQRVPQLSKHFEVSQISIYKWFNRWEFQGIEGLKIRPGRGRKRKLDIDNTAHVKQVKQSLGKENRNLNQLKSELESSLGLEISKVTLRRFLKKLVTDINDFENA